MISLSERQWLVDVSDALTPATTTLWRAARRDRYRNWTRVSANELRAQLPLDHYSNYCKGWLAGVLAARVVPRLPYMLYSTVYMTPPQRLFTSTVASAPSHLKVINTVLLWLPGTFNGIFNLYILCSINLCL